MKLNGKKFLTRRALMVQQMPSSPLYLFTLSGEDLLRVAEISRLSRNDAGKLLGYQRPVVRRHVQDIVEYLDGKDVLFPNSVILALSSSVHFTSSRGPRVSDGMATSGDLTIPIPSDGQPKPAWIVDGQQRVLAISKCKRKGMPVAVSAFVSDDVELQRDQFFRINNTKPLPRGLITELLPEITTPLPAHLAAKQIPSAVCDWLNRAPKSPFLGMIKRPSVAGKDKGKRTVLDTSLVKMVMESLASGCLNTYRNLATNETDLSGICAVLTIYWTAVKTVFPNAWGKPPEKSRLMHGAGIGAMGRLMNRIMPSINAKSPRAVKLVERELQLIAPMCRWTEGAWEELNNTRWNAIQNMPQHIQVLSNLLIRNYDRAKGKKG